MTARAEVAAALVNALATTMAYGRPAPAAADGDELRSRAEAALREAGVRQVTVDAAQAVGLRRLAERLREVFAAIQDGREDAAGDVLNALLAESDARPHLHRHPPEPWHLHYHRPDAEPVQAWTAGCVASLAAVLGHEHAARLGSCDAPGCQRVFVDASRNGSRRFCSVACQNRVKTAAHRARRR